MFLEKSNKINLFSIGLIVVLFANNLIIFKPEFASDYNTHWAYLAGTTFGYTDAKWIFPKWVYGPWYYMFCSYIFGPIFFFLYKINIIDIYYAAMYSMLCGTFLLKILTLFGSYNLGKKLFNTNKKVASIFACLLISIPFANKDFYEHSSETMGIMIFCWTFYYLIIFLENNQKKYFFIYLLLFGIGTSLKINITIPFIIFCFTYVIFNNHENEQKNLKFDIIFCSILVLLIFSVLYYLLIDNWIWQNSDFRNTSRNYGEIPKINVFLNFNILEIWENGIYPNLKNSFWNTVLADFNGDYFNSSYMPRGLNYSSEYILLKIRLGLIFSLFFFIFITVCAVIMFIKSDINFKLVFSFEFIFPLLFFLFLFQLICYSYVVYHKLGGSWDLRTSGIYALPLCYAITKILIYFELSKFKKIINYFIISIIVFSILQRIIL